MKTFDAHLPDKNREHLADSECFIAAATHDEEVRYGNYPATQNQASSGQRRGCGTVAIDNESMALMRCPSVLSAPTLMGYFYSLNAILQPPHMIRR